MSDFFRRLGAGVVGVVAFFIFSAFIPWGACLAPAIAGFLLWVFGIAAFVFPFLSKPEQAEGASDTKVLRRIPDRVARDEFSPIEGWDERTASGEPKQGIHWNGRRWLVWDQQSRCWVPEGKLPRRIPERVAEHECSPIAGWEERTASGEPKQGIHWNGRMWIVWDQQSRCWVPLKSR